MAKKVAGRSYYFDTSIFMLYVKADPAVRRLFKSKSTSGGKSYASYFTLIELNRSFINVGIELHDRIIELQDPGSALIEFSDGFGRGSKYTLILAGIIENNMQNSGLPHNLKMYTSCLESIIVDLQDEIYDLVTEFLGHYKKNPVVNSRVYSREDFEEYKEIIKTNKLDFSANWQKQNSSLKKLENFLTNEPKLSAEQKKIHVTVQKVLENVNTGYRKHFGDITIGIDSPNNATIIAKDHSFETIAPGLGKNVRYTDNISKF